MKKFLKDNTLEYQILPLKVFKEFFKIEKTNSEIIEILQKEKFVVIHNYFDNNYSVQICFNITPVYHNNGYLILVFDKNDNLILYSGYDSHTKYPPVWNREFGYINYLDFLGIQKFINKTLSDNKLPTMEYDFSLEKRSYCFTKEDPINEIPQLLKEGKRYTIIDIFAWKKPEIGKLCQEMMGFKE